MWKRDTRSQKVEQDESREMEERGVGPIKIKGVQKSHNSYLQTRKRLH